MQKPDGLSTLSYMRKYIKENKLNDKPIKLNMKRAETIKHLRKLGHWDDVHDKTIKDGQSIRKVKAEAKKSGGTQSIPIKRPSKPIAKEADVKKAFDKYVQLHLKYIDRFSDEGLEELKEQNRTPMNVLDMSNTLIKQMDDLRDRITDKKLFGKLINKKTRDAQAMVKKLSKDIKSRYEKISSVKKSAPKADAAKN